MTEERSPAWAGGMSDAGVEAGFGAGVQAALQSRTPAGSETEPRTPRPSGEAGVEPWATVQATGREARGVERALAESQAALVLAAAERDRAEAAATRYLSLLSAQTTEVWCTDATGRLLSDLPTWRSITGQTVEELLDGGWLAAVHPEDSDRVAATWAAAVERASTYTCEYRIHRVGGDRADRPPGDDVPVDPGAQVRVVAVHAVPVLRDGVVVEWVGSSVDVTEARTAEAERERLAQLARVSAYRTRVLQAVTAALSRAVSRTDVIDVALGLADRLGGSGTLLALCEPGPGEVPELHEHARTAPGEPDGWRVELGEVRSVLEHRRARFSRHAAVVPLVTSGDPFGVLAVAWSEWPHDPTPEERDLLLGLANQCAQALDRAGLYERSEERARLQTVLSEASHTLSGSLERDEVLTQLTRLVVPALADWAAVHVLGDGGAVELAEVFTADPGQADELRRVLAALHLSVDQVQGAGAVIGTGRTSLLPQVSPAALATVADGDTLDAVRRLASGSALSVPLVARGRTLGALTLVRSGPGSGPTRVEVAFVEDLARRAALAVDNATLFAAQRDVAVTLQRSLLPQALPAPAGLSCAARYLPGADGTEVGGDWYDVIALPDGGVGLAVGDVMGRGIRAAAVMGQLRAALRGYALEGHPPAEVLGWLDVVVHSIEDLPFTTCLYAVVDPDRRTLACSAAGHLPPVLIGADGGARCLELDPGLPLGVGGSAFREHTTVLDPGCTLLLYTDGLVEDRAVPLDVGLARLVEVASGAGSLPPAELVDAALAGMHRHVGHDDDVAVLAVRLG